MGKIYEQLMGELEPKGIASLIFNRLSQEEGAMLEEYFDTHIAPFLITDDYRETTAISIFSE